MSRLLWILLALFGIAIRLQNSDFFHNQLKRDPSWTGALVTCVSVHNLQIDTLAGSREREINSYTIPNNFEISPNNFDTILPHLLSLTPANDLINLSVGTFDLQLWNRYPAEHLKEQHINHRLRYCLT